jgi:drug/metabolite transporter (DMT)-like permease
MKRQSNDRSNRSRHILVFTGIAVLLWSGLEDNDAVVVTLLGAFLATAGSSMLLNSQLFRARYSRLSPPKRLALAGAIIGGLASVTTPLLMLFKDMRHAHIFPDYPPQMMLATLERMPTWALAGGLAGFGIGLLLKLRQEHL